jgi:iron complex outermembrane receptor protein
MSKSDQSKTGHRVPAGAGRWLNRTALTLAVLGSSTAGICAEAESEPAAPGTLEEIVVTAQKRSERQVDVPITVSSINGAALQAAGISSTLDLPQAVPGLRLDMSGAYVMPTIRGVGTALAGPGMNANVAIYVDGFYEPNLLGSDFELLSVSSVDVLKGPQGTLFGRNATGGAILVNTREPTQTRTAEVTASYGSFNHAKVGAYASGGITPTLAADITGYYERGDGYIKNILNGSDAAKFDKYDLRTKWVFTPFDAAKLTFTYDHRYLNDPTPNATSNYEGLSFASVIPGTPNASGPRDYSGTAHYGNQLTSNAEMLRGDFDLGFASLVSYTSYRDELGVQAKDYDGSPFDAFAAWWHVSDKTFTQEFNLDSKKGGPLSWVLGLYYYGNRNRYLDFNETVFGSPYFNGFTSDIKQTSYAAFADVTWEFLDNWFLTGGVRGTKDHNSASYYDYTNPANIRAATHTWGSVTDRAVIRYRLDDDSNVYASFSQGTKAGVLPIQESTNPVAPEKINAFEVGYKIARPTWKLDVSSFYYDYKDQQIQAFIGVISLTRNAAKSKIYGFDADFTTNLTEHYTANLALNYTHAKYDSFPGAVDYVQSPIGIFINPAVNATGNQAERAPKFTSNVGLGYHVPVAGGDLALNASLYTSTKVYFDSVNRFSQKAYELLNLRATWNAPSDHWSISVFGNNVTDEKYRVEVLPGPFAIQQLYGEPAAVGVQATVKF